MLTASQDFGRYDVEPNAAIAALMSHDGPLLLDLDETAYLRNSTEDFLDTAVPGLLALLLLRLLDAIRPWRWTGGEATRDLWRIRVIGALLPWVWILWRKRVKSLASRFANEPLLAAVKQRSGPTLFVSSGFEPIVKPLITALGFPDAQIIACRSDTTEDRVRGKLATAVAALGEETVGKSMVLTDSLSDLPLLDHCARPLRTVWEDARYCRALSRVYLPGEYLSWVKRPGQRYLMHGIVLEDFGLWLCCSVIGAPSLINHVIGLLGLLVSFWAIYERGYVENDLAALDYEKEPKLSAAFREVEVATPRVQPWIWAACFGLAGIYLLRGPADFVRDVAIWCSVLLGTYLVFWLYNRLDKLSRVWLYPVLQLARSASFVVLVPITLPASLAIGAHIIARWMPYCAYRALGKDWPQTPFYLTRLMFCCLLWIMLVVAQGPAALFTLTALLLLSWNLLRARRELRQMLAGIHRIDRTDVLRPPSGNLSRNV